MNETPILVLNTMELSKVEKFVILNNITNKRLPKKDYRKWFDIFNFYDSEDYNVLGISKVTKNVHDHYIQHQGTVKIPENILLKIKPEFRQEYFDCTNCSLTYDGSSTKDNKLKRDPNRIECGKYCRFKGHKTGNGRVIVETIRDDSECSIFLSRQTLIRNYIDDFNFILRSSRLSNLDIDHIDMNHFNDKSENTRWVITSKHLVYHAELAGLTLAIIKIRNSVEKLELKITTLQSDNEIRKIKNKINGLLFKIKIKYDIINFLKYSIDQDTSDYISKISKQVEFYKECEKNNIDWKKEYSLIS